MKRPLLSIFAILFFMCFFTGPTFCDDVEMVACATQHVELDRGLTLLEVCRSADVADHCLCRVADDRRPLWQSI